MEQLLHSLTGIDAWLVYVVLALLVFGESAAVVALVMPGELALLAAGILAARGHVSLPVVITVAVVAAVAGHAAGYEMGRRFGLSLLRWPPVRRHAPAVQAVATMVARHGGKAVLLGRWMNVGRVLVPLLAGAGHMRYRTFAVCNVLGGVSWALTFILLGTAAGASLVAVERVLRQVSWWATAIVVTGLGMMWAWRRRHRHRRRQGGDARCVVAVPPSSPAYRDA